MSNGFYRTLLTIVSPKPSREGEVMRDGLKANGIPVELRPSHVDSPAGSIAAIGLIEPLAVDKKGQLLAGGHRLAAIRKLKESNPTAYADRFKGDRIPVRVMPFNAEQSPDLALQVEVAENEQRRDYTPAEVKALAERLKQAGYIGGSSQLKAESCPRMKRSCQVNFQPC